MLSCMGPYGIGQPVRYVCGKIDTCRIVQWMRCMVCNRLLILGGGGGGGEVNYSPFLLPPNTLTRKKSPQYNVVYSVAYDYNA